MSRYIDLIIDFVSTALYFIDKYHISLDKAFQKTLRKMEKRVKGYSLRPFYEVLRDVVLNYYKLRYLEERVYGAIYGYKRCIKLWMILYGDKIIGNAKILEKYKKKLIKRMNINIDDLKLSKYINLALYYSYPSWFVDKLSRFFDQEELCKLLEKLNSETIWIRVNTLKIDIDKAIKLLEANGVEVEEDRELSYMLKVLNYKKPIYTLELLREGYIITQDKASALVVEALKPEHDELIYDICAAPGVKTSLIMQLTENKARVIAVDISRKRIKALRKLLKDYNVNLDKVDIILADSRNFSALRKADKVLVDAPCTSSGVIFKDPAIKVHIKNPGRVKYYSNVQKQLLSNAINLGDVVVYATCSLLPDEGEEVVGSVLSKNCVRLIKPEISCCPGYRGYKYSEFYCRTFPHIHDTGGFFIAVLKLVS